MEVILEGPLLRGTLSLRSRRCGKARCRCLQGQLHASWYLVQRDGGRLRQLCIPKQLQPLVQAAIKRYQEIRTLSEKLSQIAWSRLESARALPSRRRSARGRGEAA
jgi:hypothetical protein